LFTRFERWPMSLDEPDKYRNNPSARSVDGNRPHTVPYQSG
jgi:hypothetical protein